MSPRLASLTLLLVATSCAGTRPAPAGDGMLEPSALATHASEFYCEFGRWPGNAAELEAYPLPERSRVKLARGSEPVPWPLLGEADFRGEADGALRISALLPPDRLADAPPSQPVRLDLRVQPPGCWPPVSLRVPAGEGPTG